VLEAKMKPLFILAVIAGLIVLCGVGNLPCFADTGSGVSIELTTTVTCGNGNGGGSHDWSSGYGSYYGQTFQYVDNQPKRPTPYLPQVTNSPLPTPPMPPAYSGMPSPTVNSPVVESSKAIDWGFVLVIAVLAGAIALLVYLVIRMRRKVTEVS
jgi:hypothetical protein